MDMSRYASTNVGDTSDNQLEKNMKRIRQQIKDGEVSVRERLDIQKLEMKRLYTYISNSEDNKAKKSNIKRLEYVIREYNKTKEEFGDGE